MEEVSEAYLDLLPFTRQTGTVDGKEYPWYFCPFDLEGERLDFFAEERKVYDELQYNVRMKVYLERQKQLHWRLSEINPAWFIHHHLPIEDKESHVSLFDHWSLLQRKLYWLFMWFWKQGIPVRIDVLKARQMGCSTLVEGFAAWRIFLNANTHGTVMADKDENSQSIFRMIERYHAALAETLPPDKVPLKKNSKGTVLELGSKRRDHQKKVTTEAKEKETGKKEVGRILDSSFVVATASAKITKKGFTGQFFHGSEMDFWPNPRPVWSDVSQAISDSAPETIIIRESTARAAGGWWNRECDSSEAKKGLFRFLFVGWLDCPVRWSAKRQKWVWEYARPLPYGFEGEVGRKAYYAGLSREEKELVDKYGLTLEQVCWRAATCADKCSGDEGEFHRQYPRTKAEAFLAAGNTVYALSTIEHYQKTTAPEVQPPPVFVGNLELDADGTVLLIADPKGFTRIWAMPASDEVYSIGVDPSEGYGDGDPEAAQVVSDNGLEQVACCFHNGDDEHFCLQVCCLARYYHDALVTPEITGNGTKITGMLSPSGEYTVTNLYVRFELVKVGSPRINKYGHSTNRKTKPIMVGKLRRVVQPAPLLTLHCHKTAAQMGRYTRKKENRIGFGSSAQASGDDELVVGLELAMAGRASDQFDGLRQARRVGRPLSGTDPRGLPADWAREIGEMLKRSAGTEKLGAGGAVLRVGSRPQEVRLSHEILGSCA